MKKALFYIIPALMLLVCIAGIVLWLTWPMALSFGIYATDVPAYEQSASLEYMDSEVQRVRLGKDLWLTGQVVSDGSDQAPALQVLYWDRETDAYLAPIDLSRGIWGREAEDFTGSGSYIAYYEGRIIICLDAADAPDCTPSDSMRHRFVYVDESTLCADARQSIEAEPFTEDQWRYIPLGCKYYLIMEWLPENYVLTFGEHTLTAEDIVQAYEYIPYGAYHD